MEEMRYSKNFVIPFDYTFSTKIPNFTSLVITDKSSTDNGEIRTDYHKFDNGLIIWIRSTSTTIEVKSNVEFNQVPTNVAKEVKIQFDEI